MSIGWTARKEFCSGAAPLLLGQAFQSEVGGFRPTPRTASPVYRLATRFKLLLLDPDIEEAKEQLPAGINAVQASFTNLYASRSSLPLPTRHPCLPTLSV